MPGVSFKSADVPKPDTVAFNCEYSIWCDQETKLQNYYGEATKPETHAPAAQQGIFQFFMDATIAGELKTKWAMKPDANWDDCIQMVEEMMQIFNP